MAKYRITAPDGKTYIVSGGETPPTQEQALNLISDYNKNATQPEQKPNKSFKDYYLDELADIGYGAKKTFSGLTFGLSDKLLNKMGIDDKEYLARKDAEGLGDLVRGLGTLNEVGGNIIGPGTALWKGLSKAGLKGYNLASTAGGIEGGLYGLFDSEKASDIPENVAVGTVGGAIGGLLGEGAIKTAGKGVRKLKSALSSNPNKEKGEALGSLVEQVAESTGNKAKAESLVQQALSDAERTGRSVVEVADDSIIDVAQKARQKTPEARYILQSKLDEARDAQPKELRDFINETLGTSSRGNSVAEVLSNAQAKSRPIYDRLNEIGDLAEYEISQNPEKVAAIKDVMEKIKKVNTDKQANRKAWKNAEGLFLNDDITLRDSLDKDYSNLVKQGNLLNSQLAEYKKSRLSDLIQNNAVFAKAVADAKRSRSALKDLPDTDFKVINDARSKLSAMSVNRNDPAQSFDARQALGEIDPILNDIIPEYAQARIPYTEAYRYRDAADLSKQVFSNTNPEDFRRATEFLSQPEKDALAIGLRDDLLYKLGSKENQALGFKGLMTQNVQDKMRYALGNDVANPIINKAEEALNLNRNYNKLLQGSQTAEKQAFRDKANTVMNVLKNPTGVIGELINPLAKSAENKANKSLAKALTDTDIESLRQGLQWYNQLQNGYQLSPAYGISSGGILGRYLAEEF